MKPLNDILMEYYDPCPLNSLYLDLCIWYISVFLGIYMYMKQATNFWTYMIVKLET